jgi:hypothetical protein
MDLRRSDRLPEQSNHSKGEVTDISSQPEEESNPITQTSAPKTTRNRTKEEQEKDEEEFWKFASFILLFVIAAIGVIVFVGIPEMREKRIQRELEREASLRMPRVLDEILAELKSLRDAVERSNTE